MVFNVIGFQSETVMSGFQIATVSEEDGNSDLLIGIRCDTVDFSKPYHVEINHANNLLDSGSNYKNSITVNIRSINSQNFYSQAIPLINWFEHEEEITYCWMFRGKNKNNEYITVSSVRKISLECSSKGFGNMSKEKVDNTFKNQIRIHLEKIIHKEVSERIDGNKWF